jgi:hypothetical protein
MTSGKGPFDWGKKPYPRCPGCDKEFGTQAVISLHISARSNPQVTCNHCGVVTPLRVNKPKNCPVTFRLRSSSKAKSEQARSEASSSPPDSAPAASPAADDVPAVGHKRPLEEDGGSPQNKAAKQIGRPISGAGKTEELYKYICMCCQAEMLDFTSKASMFCNRCEVYATLFSEDSECVECPWCKEVVERPKDQDLYLEHTCATSNLEKVREANQSSDKEDGDSGDEEPPEPETRIFIVRHNDRKAYGNREPLTEARIIGEKCACPSAGCGRTIVFTETVDYGEMDKYRVGLRVGLKTCGCGLRACVIEDDAESTDCYFCESLLDELRGESYFECKKCNYVAFLRDC